MAEMKGIRASRSLPRAALVVVLAASAAALPYAACAVRQASVLRAEIGGLSKAEFASLVETLSEEGGYFHSDNFTSNETSYLHVVDRLRELGVSGGAYVGVGPEQNFSYIAKVRPRIAFIVDIRRQAVLQHLLYKALFQLSENRAAFLARLLSRPLSAAVTAQGEPSIESLMDYFAHAPAPLHVYAANLTQVRTMVERDFGIALSAQDREQLDYVYSCFQKEGTEIGFRFGQANSGFGYRRFPDLRDLILERDLAGERGNFLATEADYQYVRGLQLENRIVPVVGDFAGKKALAAVGDYLRKHGHSVSAFYTSNVEQFLFQNSVVPAFAENVRRLPIDERSVFIRAVPSRQPHPAQVAGHRTTTLLQQIGVFLKDYDDGVYGDYRTLVTTHYIGARQP